MTSSRRVLPLSALLIAFAAAWATYRWGPWLTFDGYHYCEFTKIFTSSWPDRFGNHWPFGYPVLGAALGRAGMPAYPALVFVSACSLVALFVCMEACVRPLPLPARIGALLVTAAAPIVAVQLGGILTELPFAAAYLGLVVLLSRGSAKVSTHLAAASLALLCLSLRYVGVLTFPVAGAALWLHGRSGKPRFGTLAVWGLAGLVALSLLATNVLASGHLSGADRAGAPGFSAFPSHLADFGWAVPTAFLGGGLRDHFDPASVKGQLAGGFLFLGLVILCGQAVSRHKPARLRLLSVSVLVYAVGICLLRCFGTFDALWNARTFLPVLPATVILAAERLSTRPRLGHAAAIICVVAGGAQALRGISREIAADIRPALNTLAPLLSREDAIEVNDAAISLSGYHPGPVRREPLGNERFAVYAAKPVDRTGRSGPLTPADLAEAKARVESRAWRELDRRPSLLILEREPYRP